MYILVLVCGIFIGFILNADEFGKNQHLRILSFLIHEHDISLISLNNVFCIDTVNFFKFILKNLIMSS